MSQWMVHNADQLVAGWRVLDLLFFSDRACTQMLEPAKAVSNGFMPCGAAGKGYSLLNCLDHKHNIVFGISCSESDTELL